MTAGVPGESSTRIVAAHRGASRFAPENTVTAFQAAMLKGAVALELDVHLTSDGQLVVIHDSHVDRTTDGQGAVRSMSVDEVGALDAGSWYSPDLAGERIPTLDQVLELTRGRARLNVELKATAADRVAAGVVEMVCWYDAVDRVVVMSFDLDSVLAAKRHATSSKGQAAAESLVVLPIVTQPLIDPLNFVGSTGLNGLNYPPHLWNPDLMQRFRDKDLIVHGGLINDRRELQDFFDRGGHFADSDDPDLFRFRP